MTYRTHNSPSRGTPRVDPTGGPGGDLCGTILAEPVISAAELQSAINSVAANASADSPGLLTVCGDVVLEARVTIPSFVIVDFGLSRITTTLAPPVGLADVPLNTLISMMGTIDGATLTTTLTAPLTAGSQVASVAATGGVVAGDYLLFDGSNAGGDLNGSTGVAGEGIWEIAQVASVGVLSFTLTAPIFNLFASAAPATRVRRVVPIIGAQVWGGNFDCIGTAGPIAVAILVEMALGGQLRGQQAAGFSRAPINLRNGARDWRVDDFRSLGGNNAGIFRESTQDVHIRRAGFEAGGARFHPNGIPRAFVSGRRRNVGCSTDAESVIGGMCQGSQEWGGVNVSMRARIRDTDPSERATRCGPGNLDGFLNGGEMGSAIEGGPNDVALAEFAYNPTYENEIERCATPLGHANATFRTAYFHDCFEGGNVTSLNIGNLGNGGGSPDAQLGVLWSDFAGVGSNIVTKGLLIHHRFNNGNFTLKLSQLVCDGSGGSGVTPSNPFFFWDTQLLDLDIDQVDLHNVGAITGFGGTFTDTNLIRFHELRADGQRFEDCIIARNVPATNWLLGQIVAIDPATPSFVPQVIAAAAGAGIDKCMAVVKGTENVSGAPMLVSYTGPGKHSWVRCDAAAVVAGAGWLEHVAAGDANQPALAAFPPGLGRPITNKAAGAPGLVATC